MERNQIFFSALSYSEHTLRIGKIKKIILDDNDIFSKNAKMSFSSFLHNEISNFNLIQYSVQNLNKSHRTTNEIYSCIILLKVVFSMTSAIDMQNAKPRTLWREMA